METVVLRDMKDKTYYFASNKNIKEVHWLGMPSGYTAGLNRDSDVDLLVTVKSINAKTLECKAYQGSEVYVCTMNSNCTLEHLISVLRVWLNLEEYEFKGKMVDVKGYNNDGVKIWTHD